MYQTEDIKELVSALSKAQGKMEPAKFNRINPHFKNRYADFTAIMEACREQLSLNGLSIMQYCETMNEKLYLVTMLAHVSGQWIKSLFPLNPKNMDSQSIGSAMTYAKRYSLSAILGIVSDEEDDDGEASHGRNAPQAQGKSRFVESLKTAADDMQKAANFPKPKINASQVAILRVQENKLNAEMKKKVYDWMNEKLKIEKFEDVTEDIFPKIFSVLEGAAKAVEQPKVEATV